MHRSGLRFRFFHVVRFVSVFWFFHDHSRSSARPVILVVRPLSHQTTVSGTAVFRRRCRLVAPHCDGFGTFGSPHPEVGVLARSLNGRGMAYGCTGYAANAMADLTRAAGLPGVPAEELAHSLVNLGVCHGRAGETARARARRHQVRGDLHHPLRPQDVGQELHRGVGEVSGPVPDWQPGQATSALFPGAVLAVLVAELDQPGREHLFNGPPRYGRRSAAR